MNPIQSFFAKYDARPVLGEKRDENGNRVPTLGEPFFPKSADSTADLIGIDAPLPTEFGITKLTAILAAFGRNLSEDYVRSFRRRAMLMVGGSESRGENRTFTVSEVAEEMKRRGESV